MKLDQCSSMHVSQWRQSLVTNSRFCYREVVHETVTVTIISVLKTIIVKGLPGIRWRNCTTVGRKRGSNHCHHVRPAKPLLHQPPSLLQYTSYVLSRQKTISDFKSSFFRLHNTVFPLFQLLSITSAFPSNTNLTSSPSPPHSSHKKRWNQP